MNCPAATYMRALWRQRWRDTVATLVSRRLVVALLAAWWLATPQAQAQSQSIEAARYVSGQGVEVLLNRNASRPGDRGDAGAAPISAPLPGGTAKAATAAATAAPAPAQAATQTASTNGARADVGAPIRVNLVEQAARDTERRRILMAELLDEGQRLEIKRRALKSPRAATDLDAATRQKLADEVRRHEENVAALGREIGRTASPAQRQVLATGQAAPQ